MTIESPFRVEGMSPGSKYVVATGGAAGTRLYETATGRVIAEFADDASSQGFGIDFSQDGSLVYLPLGDLATVVSTATGKVVTSGRRPPEFFEEEFDGYPSGGVGFSQDGKWMIAVVDDHSEVRRVDAADRPGIEVPYGATFWGDGDGSLVMTDHGLLRINPDGTVDDVLSRPSVTMHAIDYRTVGPNVAALVRFTGADGQLAEPISLLTPDGRLRPLDDTVINGQFSEDPGRSYIMASDSKQRTSLWDTSDKPKRLSVPDSLVASAWDPDARWLAATTATGDAYLVDVAWLAAMANSNPSTDATWLEQQVCEGPPRSLVADAALAQRLGEQPHSCRGS